MIRNFFAGTGYVLSAVAGLATAATFLRVPYAWARVCDFPRPQLTGLALLGGTLLLGRRPTRASFVAAGLAFLSAGWNISRIAPYLPGSPKESSDIANPDAQRIKLVVANVLMSNRNHERFLSIVREADPDILLMIEPDSRWETAAESLKDKYPYFIAQPLDNTFGMILYSRLPIERPRLRHLIAKGVPSITAIVSADGHKFILYCVHPKPPLPEYVENTNERDAEMLLIAREVSDAKLPVIVMGDFNDVAWSQTTRLFQKISGTLDPRKGRGFYNTYPAGYPFLRWALDHLFHSKEFSFVTMKILPGYGSDHLAVYTELALEPERANENSSPDSNSTDRKEADQKINEGKESADD